MKLILTVPIVRRKASLGHFTYTLQPGRIVYLVHRDGDRLRVSDVENPADRIGEDHFTIHQSSAECLIPSWPETLTDADLEIALDNPTLGAEIQTALRAELDRRFQAATATP